ncbi:hypothetical protein Y1Q_0007406 [Alligator mississippiensis]|uniref:Uncharacterized protein n=1 Tax=Alligator mississippiensis TaxID=8496 RepID=A0A151P8Q2_ALLMI|nr:hypothetical protein Y1Q_0007406 [Alligator mississippiensis]
MNLPERECGRPLPRLPDSHSTGGWAMCSTAAAVQPIELDLNWGMAQKPRHKRSPRARARAEESEHPIWARNCLWYWRLVTTTAAAVTAATTAIAITTEAAVTSAATATVTTATVPHDQQPQTGQHAVVPQSTLTTTQAKPVTH